MLWVEKYRPTTFNEVVGNEEVVRAIEDEVKGGNMNHMALIGPAGVGKTTMAEVIAHYLFDGPDDSRFKELNASDTRGIDVIRNEVKKFAGRKTLSDQYKIIFLDEADSLTRDAQQALRRTMENYQDSCRFILTGNYSGGFIDPILSRCSDYVFDPIEVGESVEALRSVSQAEGYSIDEEVFEKIARIKPGDLRSQIIKLQGLCSGEGEVTPDDISAGEDYLTLLNFIGKKQFMSAKKLATEPMLRQLYNYVMQREDVPGRVKAEMSITYAKYLARVKDSPDKDIQLNALVAELIKQISDHIT